MIIAFFTAVSAVLVSKLIVGHEIILKKYDLRSGVTLPELAKQQKHDLSAGITPAELAEQEAGIGLGLEAKLAGIKGPEASVKDYESKMIYNK